MYTRLIMIVALAAGPSAAWAQAAEDGERPSLPRHEWTGPVPQQDFACRHPGGEVPQGTVLCIERSSCQVVTARCERRENNAVWITLHEGCEQPVS